MSAYREQIEHYRAVRRRLDQGRSIEAPPVPPVNYRPTPLLTGPQLSIHTMVEVVCAHHGITISELRSTNRTHACVQARMICDYLLHRIFHVNNHGIAAVVGQHRTSVLHGLDTAKSQLADSRSPLRPLLVTIVKRFGLPPSAIS